MNKIDLHLHTTISDGTDTPEEILTHVHEAGIDLFSITDHDSIKGGIIMPSILANYESERPAFIRGVEFSCEDESGKMHILGYGYDPEVSGILDVVGKGHELRMIKAKARLEFLEGRFGFSFSNDEIMDFLSNDNPGKPHLAKMMVDHGYAEDIAQAIKEYINKKKFDNVHIRPEDAIEGILRSGGIPVLAHPSYGDGDDLIMGEDMEQRLKHLMEYGLQGVEAFYSGFTPKIQNEVLGLAEKYSLYVTAGSDYHGQNKMVQIGWTNLDDMSDAPEGLRCFLETVNII